MFAACTRTHTRAQAVAGSLQSLCWASAAVGGITSAYFSGSFVQVGAFMRQKPNRFCVCMSVCACVCVCGWVGVGVGVHVCACVCDSGGGVTCVNVCVHACVFACVPVCW